MGIRAPMTRARASASATREVSTVIQRRPHCSADVGGRPGAARGIKHEISGVGRHQDTTLNYGFVVSLYHITFWICRAFQCASQ